MYVVRGRCQRLFDTAVHLRWLDLVFLPFGFTLGAAPPPRSAGPGLLSLHADLMLSPSPDPAKSVHHPTLFFFHPTTLDFDK